MLTGGPEFSYKPSGGEPVVRNHKKGYFNDPDLKKYGPRYALLDECGITFMLTRRHTRCVRSLD